MKLEYKFIRLEMTDRSWELVRQLHAVLNYIQVCNRGPLLTPSEVIAAIADQYVENHSGVIQERFARYRLNCTRTFTGRSLPAADVAAIAGALDVPPEEFTRGPHGVGRRAVTAEQRSLFGARSGPRGALSGVPRCPRSDRRGRWPTPHPAHNAAEEARGLDGGGTEEARRSDGELRSALAQIEELSRRLEESAVDASGFYRPRGGA